MNNTLEFTCEIEREVYNSPDYKIYGAYVDTIKFPFVELNKYGNVTLVGNLHDLMEGITYHVKAQAKTGKYGISYEVLNIRRDLPKDKTETTKFLREILTPNQADVLIDAYPNIVQKIMNNDLSDVDLSKTKGIKEYTFNVIRNKIIENFALTEIIEKYGGYGITFSMLKKLYDKFSSMEKLEQELRDNPYKSLCSISGVGFKTADNIILSIPQEVLQVDYNIRKSKQRMKACIMYVLEDNESDGNTKIGIKKLRDKCSELTPECINHFIDIIKEDADVYLDKANKAVATKVAYETEIYIADKILSMLENPKPYTFNYNIYNIVDGVELTEDQMSVLKNLCQNNISLLSGFAGSGKSFCTKAVIKMLDDNNLSYILLAPTGKAAKVLGDYCNRPASTIHRGLGYNPMCGWTYNEKNKLDYDVVICDETGMVDIYLMKHLLEAIDEERTKIIFIQDPAQIPSVSSGNCSNDMIESSIIPITKLNKIFRYNEGGLYNVATKVRNGEYYVPETNDMIINFGDKKDYSLIVMDQEKTIDNIANLYEKLLKNGATIDDIMILSHHNKGEYGSKKINEVIQSKINPRNNKKYIKYGETYFIEGDKVIQIVNNYKIKNIYDEETAIFNGNTGTIQNIVNNQLIVNFDGEMLIYNKEDLGQLLLGYAISIHKSQGSGSKYVIITTPKAHTYFINRNLLYTAITRTKEKCFHFSGKEIIKSSLKKSITLERQTFLKNILNKIIKTS